MSYHLGNVLEVVLVTNTVADDRRVEEVAHQLSLSFVLWAIAWDLQCVHNEDSAVLRNHGEGAELWGFGLGHLEGTEKLVLKWANKRKTGD